MYFSDLLILPDCKKRLWLLKKKHTNKMERYFKNNKCSGSVKLKLEDKKGKRLFKAIL